MARTSLQVLGNAPMTGQLRTRLGHIGHLVTGNMANAAIMLLGTLIAARALGPEAFGLMTLVLALGRTTERLVRFETWQPIIRFAAELESGEEAGGRSAAGDLARLFALGFWLDVAAALVAATLAVLVAIGFADPLGLPREAAFLVMVYAVALLFNWPGMATAVLRLSGRFKWLAYYQFAASALRVLLALACWAMDFGIVAFIAVWTASQVVNSAFFLVLAARSLREKGITMPWLVRPFAWRGRFPGFTHFAISTNLTTSLRTLTVEADTLLVGALAGPSAAGFYHLAKRLAKVAQQIGAHVQAVLYPDIARMWWRGEVGAFLSTTRGVQLALAAFGVAGLVAAWAVGEQVIRLAFGTAYADAYPLLLTQMAALVFILHTAPSRSAILAMNRPGLLLATTVVGVIIFFAFAFATVPSWGALGASAAHVVLAVFVAVVLDAAVWWAGRSATGTAPLVRTERATADEAA